MTQLLSEVEAPSDAELISRVRGGDTAAYGELFARHVEAARRLSRQLVRGSDADDLVSEAFAKMLQVLQGGGGPDVAFRAYLLTSVRRLHVDRIRATSRLQTTDDMAQYDAGVPFQDTAVASFENGAAARAFSSLPERWQLVLWHLEVEGQKPAEIAPLLGMSANSVSALAYRAREGLRQAFLTMHLADSATEECRWANEHLGGFVRKGLSRRDTTKVQDHLDGCRRCTAMYLELTEVNSNLSALLAPLLLGSAAAGYLSSGGTAAGLSGVSAVVGRVRDAVGANAAGAGTTVGSALTTGGMVTVGGLVAAGVAAITTAAFVLGGIGDRGVVEAADQVLGVMGTAPAPNGVDPTENDSPEPPGAVPVDAEVDAAADAEAGADLGATSEATAGSPVGAAGTATDPAAAPGASAEGTTPDSVGPPVAPAPQPGLGPDGEVTTGPGTEPRTDVPDPGTGPGVEPVAPPAPDTDPAPGPGTGPGAGSDTGTDPSAGPDAGSGSGSNPDPDPGTDPTPGTGPGSNPDPDSGTDPDSGSGPVTSPGVGPIPTPKPAPAPAPGKSDGETGGGNTNGPGGSDGTVGGGNENASPSERGGGDFPRPEAVSTPGLR